MSEADAAVVIRDPSAEPGTPFSEWREIRGLEQFTLKPETGSVTETALLDGSISFVKDSDAGD